MPEINQDWQGIQLSDGRYDVREKLGEGGMGIVYRAHDNNLDSPCVIKAPNLVVLSLPGFAERFVRETRSLVKLSHPHIVKINDVGRYNNVPFAVMQYLPGGDLDGRRMRDADGQPVPADLGTLAVWLAPIAEALDFMHQQGFVHRDVKPANILFDAHGNAYLSDFGLVKVVAESAANDERDLTTTGLLLGTPGYVSPELALGGEFDGRADQYALAVTVYELLAGQRAFSGTSPAAVLVDQSTNDPRELASLCEGIPSAVSAAVHCAMSRDPTLRFRQCQDFSKAVLSAAPRSGAVPITDSDDVRTTEVAGSQPPTVSQPSERSSPAPQTQRIGVATSNVATQTITIPSKTSSSKRWAIWLSFAVIVGGGIVYSNRNLELTWTDGADDSAEVEGSGVGDQPAATLPNHSTHQAASGESAASGNAFSHTLSDTLVGHEENVLSLAFDAAGKRLVSGGNSKLLLWSLTDGQPLAIGSQFLLPIPSVAFSHNGKWLVAGYWDGNIRFWDALAGTLRSTVPVEQDQVVQVVAVSSDDSMLAASGWGDFIGAWGIADGKPVGKVTYFTGGHTKEITSLAFAANGSPMASGSADNSVVVWNRDTREQVVLLEGHEGPVRCVTFAPNSQTLASAGEDAKIRLWDMERGESRGTLDGHLDIVYSIAIRDDGRVLASGSKDRTVKLWNPDTGELLHTWRAHEGQIRALAFSPDGEILATTGSDHTIKLWALKEN